MEKHQAWYEELKAAGAGQGETRRAIRESIGVVFGKILGNAGVYKDTEAGREAFRRVLRPGVRQPPAPSLGERLLCLFFPARCLAAGRH